MNDDWFDRLVKGFMALVAVGVVGWLIWYEVNDPGHGTITRKQYHPAHWYNSCSGNPSTCTMHYQSECYSIKYTDGHHDGDACVSPHEYETYQVGEQYPHVVTPPKEPAQ